MPAKSKNAIIFEIRFQISLLAYVDYQTFICIISSLWNIPLLTEFVVCIVNYNQVFLLWSLFLLCEMQGQKSFTNSFRVVCFKFVCLFVCEPFFFPWWAEEITDLCRNVKMTIDISTGHKIKKKDLLLPIFGFVAQKSVISCCTIIPFHLDQGSPYGALIKTV